MNDPMEYAIYQELIRRSADYFQPDYFGAGMESLVLQERTTGSQESRNAPRRGGRFDLRKVFRGLRTGLKH